MDSGRSYDELFILYCNIYLRNFLIKGVLNPNFRPISFKLKKKIRFFEMNFDLGFRVL